MRTAARATTTLSRACDDAFELGHRLLLAQEASTVLCKRSLLLRLTAAVTWLDSEELLSTPALLPRSSLP
ncbi:MAG: hypothetical protein JWM64_1201 [Frankiales bacterium]|nr:hypothetical protein [Frankiales bacterium]